MSLGSALAAMNSVSTWQLPPSSVNCQQLGGLFRLVGTKRPWELVNSDKERLGPVGTHPSVLPGMELHLPYGLMQVSQAETNFGSLSCLVFSNGACIIGALFQ